MERAGKSRRGERDRISSLPDCLIHLIMSFLTAQQAVRTCILSKRWQNLWTTLPFLDFDLLKFECDGELDDSDPQRNKSEKFRDFVSTTLLLREASDVHTFRLSCFGISNFYKRHTLIRSWIVYALKHNVQVFSFDSNGHHGLLLESSLPLGFFNCAFLVDASLSSIFLAVDNIEAINLPCLRRLCLRWIDLNQDFVDKLLCGCPVLELLHLRHCYREYSTINSQSLKYLIVEDRDFGLPTEREMELINTPNLLSFCYTTNVDLFGPKMLLKMPSLTSANICIDCILDRSENRFKGKSNILIGLSDVQNLKLSGSMLNDLLENELPNCPEFLNVKDLSVDGLCLSCHINLLASFLNHCPNLEKLSLLHVYFCCKLPVHGNQESSKIAPFKGKRLTTVEVKFYKCDKNFPGVVKYLQDITGNSGAQINMTSTSFWS